MPQPARHPGKGKAEGLPAGSSALSLWSNALSIFPLLSFGIFISLCDAKCKSISMAASAAGWLPTQLLLVFRVVEVAGWHCRWEPQPFALLASRLGRGMLELRWAGLGEVPQGKLILAWVWSEVSRCLHCQG